MSTQASDMDVQVRILSEHDAAAYQAIRLQSLQEHPEAFASSFEDEVRRTMEEVAQLLTSPSVTVYGAFDSQRLIGIVALIRNTRPKMAHRASIGGMYVSPSARGRGAGKALLDAAIAQALASTELEDLALEVTCGNESARALYIKAGFQSFGVNPRLLKLGDQYFDIESMLLSLREAKAHG
jgi:ribosomal protein S18 acetylase RimI-like enzyme